MIWDLFSRLILAITSFAPSQFDPSSPSLQSPGNLSLAQLEPSWGTNSFEDGSWQSFWGTNDTVTIDNPYFEHDLEDDDEGDTFHQLGYITLPICCKSIHPEGKIGAGVASASALPNICPTSDSDSSSNSGGTISYSGSWYPSLNLFPTENRSHYKFEVRRPSSFCTTPLKVVKLSMDEFEVGLQGRFLRNGYFGYNNDHFYSPLEYCISGLTGEFVQVMICDSYSKCGSSSSISADTSSTSPSIEGGRRLPPCIQKCCNPDEIYSFTRRSCIKSKGALFSPIFYHDLSTQLSPSESADFLPHYHIAFPRTFKHHCMENRTQIFPAGAEFARLLSNFTGMKYYSAHFRFRKDGVIMYRKDGKALILPDQGYPPVYVQDNSKKCFTLKSMSHYCIDGGTEYGSPNPFNNDPNEIFFVTCSEYLLEPPNVGPLSFVYGNVMITSSIFSLLTVIVYTMLKEKQNLHGWTIASYAFSMFLMYIFLGLAHLIRYYKSDEVLKTASCVTIGIASHLFSMSSFLWLTLMNWDIWWTFRKFRPTTQGNRGHMRGKEIRHFLTYSVFGWGLPLVITGISTFIHFKYEEASEDDCALVQVPLPAYGRESCEIKQLSLGVYLYFPAAFLLTTNLIFFAVTSYRLCRHNRQTKIATKSIERHNQSVELFAKLFFVMGVTRVFEVITWAGSGPTLTWYWALFDIFNVLQAVAIFIIYVCKRDVLHSLKMKLRKRYYGQKENRSGTTNRTTTLHQSQSQSPEIRLSSSKKFTKLNSEIDSQSDATTIIPLTPTPSPSSQKKEDHNGTVNKL